MECNSNAGVAASENSDVQVNRDVRITIDATVGKPNKCKNIEERSQFNNPELSRRSSLCSNHETSLCSTSDGDHDDYDDGDFIRDTSDTESEEVLTVQQSGSFCDSLEQNNLDDSCCCRYDTSEIRRQARVHDQGFEWNCSLSSGVEDEGEEEKENIPLDTAAQNCLDPFTLLDDYNRIEPKDRPTPIDLEAGVFWFVIPNPNDCGVIWRIWPHKPKLGRLRLLNRALELTEGPYNKDGGNKKSHDEPKVKKLVDLYRAFSIHIRVKHPVMGDGMCLALVFIGETVLLKPETRNDADVDYWHRLMMSIKIKDFPEIYGRPVTRHDFMDVAWAVSIVGRPTIWDSPDPFHGSADIYKAHRFFQGPKWFAIYDNTLYLCDQDVIPQRCNPPYRPDNSVEIPWSVVYQIGVERCYFYMRMTANGPWGLGTIYLMLESWDAAKAVSAHFRYLSNSKNPFQKIRVRDAEESEDVPQDESKSWFFSLSGWKSRQRRERLREEGKNVELLPENRRIDLFDRLIPKTQEDLEIEMEQMSAPPIREQILQAIALWHTHPPPPYPRTLEEAMEPKSFFPGPPEERDVPKVSDDGDETEFPTTSSTSRGRRNAEKIKFFAGVDYVHMENDGTILTDEQPCIHGLASERAKAKLESDVCPEIVGERADEALTESSFKVQSVDEQQVNFHKARKRASTNQTFFDRRLSGIFRRAHSFKTKWLGGIRKSKLGSMTDAELFKWPVLERRIRQDSFGDTDTDLFPKTVYGQSYLKEIHEKKRTYPEQEEDVQWDFSGTKPKPYHKFTYELAAALQLDANVKAALKREGLSARSGLASKESNFNDEHSTTEEVPGNKTQSDAEVNGTSLPGRLATDSEDEYIECDHECDDSKVDEKSKSKMPKEKSDEQDEADEAVPVEVPDSPVSPETIDEKTQDRAGKRVVLKECRIKELRALLQSNITDEEIQNIVQAEFLAEDAAVYAKELSKKAASSLACAKKADQEAKYVREIADRCDIEACKAQADASDASAKAALAAAKLAEIRATYGVPAGNLTNSERNVHKVRGRVGHKQRRYIAKA